MEELKPTIEIDICRYCHEGKRKHRKCHKCFPNTYRPSFIDIPIAVHIKDPRICRGCGQEFYAKKVGQWFHDVMCYRANYWSVYRKTTEGMKCVDNAIGGSIKMV